MVILIAQNSYPMTDQVLIPWSILDNLPVPVLVLRQLEVIASAKSSLDVKPGPVPNVPSEGYVKNIELGRL